MKSIENFRSGNCHYLRQAFRTITHRSLAQSYESMAEVQITKWQQDWKEWHGLGEHWGNDFNSYLNRVMGKGIHEVDREKEKHLCGQSPKLRGLHVETCNRSMLSGRYTISRIGGDFDELGNTYSNSISNATESASCLPPALKLVNRKEKARW